MLAEDATLLRQSFEFLLEAEVQPISLVHDLQNHDEITYQLVEFDRAAMSCSKSEESKCLAADCGKKCCKPSLQGVWARAPHNKLYRPQKDGLATTFPGFVAAALNIRDPYHASADEVASIRQAHLLLAAANAMQPGVFGLSSWDLVGAPANPRGCGLRVHDRWRLSLG